MDKYEKKEVAEELDSTEENNGSEKQELDESELENVSGGVRCSSLVIPGNRIRKRVKKTAEKPIIGNVVEKDNNQANC